MELPLVAVLNGPNINMLGLGEPDLYGTATLDDLEQICAETAIDFRQTNSEGEIISWVQECRGGAGGIVINPGGYAATPVALSEAPRAVALPFVEVQLS